MACSSSGSGQSAFRLADSGSNPLHAALYNIYDIMYHYIYKITCLVTNRYYIGLHSTYDLSDGYLGSGKIIKLSIKKYGKDNHQLEILEFLPDKSSLKIRESELVNESLISDPNCMNIQLGGGGGFIDPEHAKKAQSSGGKKTISLVRDIHFQKLKTDEIYHRNWKNSMSISKKGDNNPFYGKKHSQETIDNMSLNRKGRGMGQENSQFGTCWISHPELGTKKIKKDEFILFENEGWCKGRKIKN